MPARATALDPSLLPQLVALSPGAVALVRLGDEVLVDANARMASLMHAEGTGRAPGRSLSLSEMFDPRTCSGLRAELALRGAVHDLAGRLHARLGGQRVLCSAHPYELSGELVALLVLQCAGPELLRPDPEPPPTRAPEFLEAAQSLAGKATLDATLGAMNEAVFIVDAHGNIVTLNEQFAITHRYPDLASCLAAPEDYIRVFEVRTLDGQLVPVDDWTAARALRGESGVDVLHIIRRVDLGVEWIGSYNYAPVRDAAGEVIGAVVTSRDVTEQRRIAEQLARHRESLEELVRARTLDLAQATAAAESASRAKSAFLASMSHEIRTPLNAVLGMAELLRSDAPTETQRARLNTIRDAASHLLGVISDILELSRIEADKLPLEEADFDVSALLEGVLSVVAASAAHKGLALAVDTRALPTRLRGDRIRLAQMLVNYTSNAVKFTDRGEIWIRGRVESDDAAALRVRFEVEDTGLGLAPGQAERIFLPFEQGESGRAHGGAGLGLTINRRLAELMGGAVGVESRAGRGCTFWFTARLARPTSARADTLSAASVRAELRREHVGKRVLLVEDDRFNQQVALEALRLVGLEAVLAGSGEEALELVRGAPFAAVLMDMQLPGMSGIEAAQALRAQPGHGSVPIIAMTANAFEEDRRACLEAGMDGFLTKPFEFDALFETLHRWLGRRP
jgi:two-component system, sensor histidine kinase and response regulator